MLVPTTTTEPPGIAYLTRTWGMLSSEPPLEVAWSVMERCVGGGGGAAADRHSTMMRASCRERRCLFQPPLPSRQFRSRRSGYGGLPHRAGRPVSSTQSHDKSKMRECSVGGIIWRTQFGRLFGNQIKCLPTIMFTNQCMCVTQAAYLILGEGSVASADRWEFPSADAMDEECERGAMSGSSTQATITWRRSSGLPSLANRRQTGCGDSWKRMGRRGRTKLSCSKEGLR